MLQHPKYKVDNGEEAIINFHRIYIENRLYYVGGSKVW